MASPSFLPSPIKLELHSSGLKTLWPAALVYFSSIVSIVFVWNKSRLTQVKNQITPDPKIKPLTRGRILGKEGHAPLEHNLLVAKTKHIYAYQVKTPPNDKTYLLAPFFFTFPFSLCTFFL